MKLFECKCFTTGESAIIRRLTISDAVEFMASRLHYGNFDTIKIKACELEASKWRTFHVEKSVQYKSFEVGEVKA